MASSSSNPHITLEIEEEEYPYPSHVCAPNFVTFKLSCKDEYRIWKTQTLCLLKSHAMLGFIDGTLVSPQRIVSGKEKVGDPNIHWLWTRSDSLVKGWILGSLSKETLGCVLDRLTDQQTEADCSAMDVWNELQTMYGHAVLPQLPPVVADKHEEERAEAHEHLDRAIRSGDWDLVLETKRKHKVTSIEKITNNGNTALHVAVGTTQKPQFILNLLKLIPENVRLSAVRNSDGNTPLHVAAIIGYTEAAKILVERNRDLLLAKNKEGHTSLAIALSGMHTETSHFLLVQMNTDIEKDTLFYGTSGDELLVSVISSKNFDLANDLMRHLNRVDTDAVLMAIAQNFPSELNKITSKSLLLFVTYSIIRGIFYLIFLFPRILKMLVRPFIIKRVQVHADAMELLETVCRRIKHKNDPNSFHRCYTNPIFEAIRENAYEVVHWIVPFFKNAIWSTNKDGHNIIQYAVINRSEKVYNLLYHMSDHKNIYRTIKDSSGNNLLHLAARLAPTNKLNLISGAALQIQSELQWFKEVEGFVCPLNIKQKNSFDETPQMVFTREHKELVIEGEKWMKATAESYTITAALITTIVFAAAITVPGGNNQDTGIPLFTNHTAFTIFAISDAISLFAAVTSLLMFLSILTARFAEQDFLFKLPTKLIIGLATLFISTTAMIIAFGATLYLVFGQRNSRILTPIVVLTCLPITSFVTLQFPLIIDLVSATYGRRIFGKKYVAYSKDSLERMKRPFY
ncbi:unnamed protein product [Lactuca virosa]|uniref:PGG domain-containing protein n=1 Tax=Lactuca virosa TaxID=75947 RepID=A0AAU9PGT7_9ASTR|nr:unnamed protein product [Lactuca virosa]